jgi:thymidylate synthase (FAD)
VSYEIEFTDRIRVELVASLASDDSVVAAARVSTKGIGSLDELSQGRAEGTGLINYLMKHRHGTPFEHNYFTFFVHAPIFVFREWHRHRVGWSFNEESGRYKQLEPLFYIPGPSRNLVQHGKPGDYSFEPGTEEQFERMVQRKAASCAVAYSAYLDDLEDGIAREVARMHLPVNIYSSMYATCNARSIMSFLSLRQQHPEDEALFPSSPMAEINYAADVIEEAFAAEMPITYDAYVRHQRVSP